MSVLVLGNGLLGSELCKQTKWNCISRRDGFDASQPNFKLISEYNIIVNCIANTNSYSNNLDEHLKINYTFAIALSDYCRLNNKKLVHISTEFVYANNAEKPLETDIALPDDTFYAKTKLFADQFISFTNPNALICRELHKPYPFTYPEVWNIQTSGDTVDKIADLIIKLINKNAKGIFNVGTGDKFLSELSPNSKVIPPPSYVPIDTRMNLNKLNNFLNENY